MLYHRSSYFHRALQPLGHQSTAYHFLHYPKKMVGALLAYVHSDTFALPADIAVEDLPDFTDLVNLLELPRSSSIRTNIHSHLNQCVESVRWMCLASNAFVSRASQTLID